MGPVSSLSKMYLYIPVYGAAGTEPVEIAFTDLGAEPVEDDWKTASWANASARGADARILIGPGGTVQLADGTYQAWVRVASQVEHPVLLSGLIDII